MKLVDDWRKVASHSLSFYMQIAGLLAMVLPELWFHFTGQDYDPFLSWWLGIALLLAGIIGRLIQQNLSPWRERLRLAIVLIVAMLIAFTLATEVKAATPQVRAEPATLEETLDIAVPLVAKWEGNSLTAYLDTIADPPVWTICHGHVEGVYAGMTMTASQCDELLRHDLISYRERLHKYFTLDTISYRLPPPRDAAFTSLGYNCGPDGIGRSTAVRRLNAGDIVGACDAMTWWKYAGKRVVRGLFNRRLDERDQCMIGA